MSNESKETIADIVSEMRNESHAGDASCLEWVGAKMRSYSDRIEAAANHQFRDTTKMIPEEVAVSKMETTTPTCEKSSQVGNTAAMREALEDARRFVSASAQRTDRDLLIMDEKRGAYVLTPKETLIKIDAALSSPPRNCDIMDWRTAWAKWLTECHPQKLCGYAEVVSGTEQFMDWYMSEAKGETK